MRTRVCTPPKYGGESCSVLGAAVDKRECNTKMCPVKRFHVAHACQGGTATLDCKKGNGKINILDGFYGRQKVLLCGQTQIPFWNYMCRLDWGVGTKIVATLCNKKQVCHVKATNEVFGKDPCRGTYKYAEIMYECYGGRYPDVGDEEEQ